MGDSGTPRLSPTAGNLFAMGRLAGSPGTGVKGSSRAAELSTVPEVSEELACDAGKGVILSSSDVASLSELHDLLHCQDLWMAR